MWEVRINNSPDFECAECGRQSMTVGACKCGSCELNKRIGTAKIFNTTGGEDPKELSQIALVFYDKYGFINLIKQIKAARKAAKV